MRILLIGEFSRLHNSLKEGLEALGNEVFIVGNGDGFKNYPVDYSTKAKWCETRLGTFIRKIIFKLTRLDIIKIEFGTRFYFHLNKLKNFDVVQLINESPIQTVPVFERFLLKKVFNSNQKSFLLCCGVDYIVMKYMIEKRASYSILNPYFENPKSHNEYGFMFEFMTKNHQKTHRLIYQNTQGVIASDIDYYLPLQNNPKFLGLIPNPINLDKIKYIETKIEDKIIIFLGINEGTYNAKGITFFETALEIIEKKYSDKITIIKAQNVPYQEYIILYNKAHIILDQVYGYDQGYNALEAMAKGKAVFTGAEKEFTGYYNLTDWVAINALPDVNQIINELSFLIDNPEEIIAIGKRARIFVEKEHNYIKIAEKYLEIWKECKNG